MTTRTLELMSPMLYEIKDSIYKTSGSRATFKDIYCPSVDYLLEIMPLLSKLLIIANNGPILAQGCEIKNTLAQRWANCW